MTLEELNSLLIKAENEFNLTRYDKAAEHIGGLMRCFEKIYVNNNVILLQIQSYLLQSRIEWKQSHYEKTIENASIALALADKLAVDINEKQIFKAKAFNMLGLAYWNIGKLSLSVDNYYKALEISEIIDEKRGVAIVTGNIGMVYRKLRDYQKSLEFYRRSLHLYQELNNPEEIAGILGDLGVVHFQIGNYDEALTYYLQSLAILEQLNNKKQIAQLSTNIGHIYLIKKEHVRAIAIFNNSLDIYLELNSLPDIAYVKYLLGSAYSQKEFSNYDPENAKKCLLESIEILKELNAEIFAVENYKILSEIYEDEGSLQEFAYNIKQYHRLILKELNEKSAKQAQRYSIDYQLTELQLEQQNLKDKNDALAELNMQLAIKNQQLIKADEEKNDFMSMAAHDLKNPLGAVTMIAKILANDAEAISSKDIHELATDIHTLSKRMFDLVSNLLYLNKVEQGIMPNDKSLLSISDVIYPIVKQHILSAEKKDVKIICQIKDLQLYNSPSVLFQILDNLISNAVKFTFKNTIITIATELIDAAHLRICITDEGPGLTETDRLQIFGRFKRLSAQPTFGEQSNGLGLAIVKKLVETIGGHIRYDSDLGRGTTFYVELPRNLSEEI